MQITERHITTIMPQAHNNSNLSLYVTYINGYADKFHIDTPLRMAHFLAQVAHETSELRYMKELGAESHFSRYEQGKLKQALGNTQKGDGKKYRGRGFMQLTGRANYQAYQDSPYCRGDIMRQPELLEQPLGAVKSGMWYWMTRKLNQAADKDEVMLVTRLINGGTNGLASRKTYLARAKKALGIV